MRVIADPSGCAAMMNTVNSQVDTLIEADGRFMLRPGGTVALHDRALVVIGALLFTASAASTIYRCGSMSGGMPMPRRWTMSMAWMPGQTWLGAGGSFMGMWMVMMVAMMLPSFLPMLLNYRRSVTGHDGSHRRGLLSLVGAGYLFVWAIVGALAYPLGTVLAAGEMRWPALSRSAIAKGVPVENL